MTYTTNNDVYTPTGIANPQINNSKAQWLRTANDNNKNVAAVSMGSDLATLFSKLNVLDPHYKKVIMSFLDTCKATKLSSTTIDQHVFNIGLDGSSSENDQITTNHNSSLKAIISGMSTEEQNLFNTIIATLRDSFADNSGLTVDQIKSILADKVHFNTILKYVEIEPRTPFINTPLGSKQLSLVGKTTSGEVYDLSCETVEWTSASTGVATIILATGIVTAVSDGTSVITGKVTSIVPNISTTVVLTVSGQ